MECRSCGAELAAGAARCAACGAAVARRSGWWLIANSLVAAALVMAGVVLLGWQSCIAKPADGERVAAAGMAYFGAVGVFLVMLLAKPRLRSKRGQGAGRVGFGRRPDG